MTGRSLRASAEGIQIIRKAIKRDGWKQEELKEELGLKTRQPITRLLRGEAIERPTFEELCHLLGIEVQDVAALETEILQTSPEENIDNLVQEVRDRIKPLIEQACGTMRVLDMSYPIGLDDIYTDVNILERLTSRRGLKLAEMMQEAGREQFERFCLGSVQEERVPGLVAVERFSKLMILGKPGAGKTTFLKRLAMLCIGGKFKADYVPVFVTLKDFAEADRQPSLLKYIDRWAGESLEAIVQAGKAMILLDGLDEVRGADSDRVLRQIKTLSQQFGQNCFVITCRIAAKEYTFEQFTEVEVADFDDTQIAEFSNNWFRCRDDAVKAKRFLEKLEEDEPIRELAASPLLLTLLCLVFEDSGDFPTNRAELYQNGVDVLLKKWDVKRNIERDQIYRGLSLKRKEALLSHIAYKTFEAGNYFFKKRETERYICEYIQNLPGASTDPEVLEIDSAAVLKSIEANHGLLVERARGIYSFSHLTFHEYFAASDIVKGCNSNDSVLRNLAGCITEPRWREVLLLTVSMLEPSDTFLLLIKNKIDNLMAKDEILQQFLSWVNEKSHQIKTDNKGAAIRAFYIYLITHSMLRSISLAMRSIFRLIHHRDENSDESTNKILEELENALFSLQNVLNSCLHGKLDKFLLLDIAQKEDVFGGNLNWEFSIDYALEDTLGRASLRFSSGNFLLGKLGERGTLAGVYTCLEDALACIAMADEKLESLENTICELREEISRDIEDEKEWWDLNKITWTEKLRSAMIKYRNIGHNWQFTKEQKTLLQQYYDANELLVDCLNSDCYVSLEVRQEIEETLLLPIAEIEAWKKNKGKL